MYPKNTIYVLGEAKSPGNNAITKEYDSFFIGFVVDTTNNLIVDTECTSMLDITSKFVNSIFVGQSMADCDWIEEEVTSRYFGSSQKAIIVAFKQAHKKYMNALHK
ncbi:DUF3870 domain-containing protein [Radiobacillus deserti]|uniref:DUF3870 domain-containing protein n=1 Tax=Radiobacillus deserti TaxID=2594883 RepID=A0A516KJ90_9BACI|nr:DUF3870 domain-containing protein [Radiobacillus deserti]QDP41448.1 DUF3870 domain-containing protein [Radiobacillus deserti]